VAGKIREPTGRRNDRRMTDNLIYTIHVFQRGDHSVGIQDFEARIESNDFLIDLEVLADEDRSVYLEDVREAVRNLFEVITGGNSEVLFDFEIRNELTSQVTR